MNEPRSPMTLEEVAEEFLASHRRGESPSIDDYAARYPELADEIRDTFGAMLVMEEFAPNSSATVDHSGNGRRVPRGVPVLEQLGDFRVVREVGRGGMGIVYEAEQVSLGRRVALKILPQQMLLDSKQRRRFEREARAAARLHHTNIVPVFGVGEHDGMLYYVMQFIQGLGLDEVLDELKVMHSGAPRAGAPATRGELRVTKKDVSAADVARSLMSGQFDRSGTSDNPPPIEVRPPLTETVEQPIEPLASAPVIVPMETSTSSTASGRLSDTFSISSSSVSLPGASEARSKTRSKHTYWHSVAHIGGQVASALQYAHEQGVLHRDVKPSNLLLDTRGTVWVTDFGLAKADDQQDLTHTGDIIGTLRYMPPEAFEGKTDPRSDVYSLGLTLYELAALRPAFYEADRHRLIKQVTTGQPMRLDYVNPGIPADLVTIVHKAIDRDPKQRYATAGDFGADLQRFLDDEPIKARRIGPVERLRRWARHNRGLAASLAAIAALLVVGAVASVIAAARFRGIADEKSTLAEGRRVALGEAESALAATKLAHDAARTAQAQEKQAREHAQNLAEDNRVGLVRFNASRGAEILDRGDAFAALPWFAEALRLDQNDAKSAELHRLRLATTLRSAPKLVHSFRVKPGAGRVIFSPDGARIAATNTRLSNWLLARIAPLTSAPVSVWNVATGQAAPILPHDRGVMTVAFSPTGEQVATAGMDNDVRLWDATSGALVRTLKHNTYSVLAVAYSADGKRLLTAGSYHTSQHDAHVQVWDPHTGVRLLDLTHANPVATATFNGDGRRIAAASGNAVHVWDATNGSPIGQPLRGVGTIVHVAFSPDGQRVLAAELDGRSRVWDIASGQPARQPALRDVLVRGFSADGRRAASINRQGNAVQVWDLEGGEAVTQPLAHDLEVNDVEFSRDGRLVVSAAADRTARVWSADTGDLLAVLRHPTSVVSATFDPDGRQVASQSAEGVVRVWDLAGMAAELPVLRHDAYVHRAVYSWDGSILATASADGTARLWDTASGKPLIEPLRHVAPVVHLAFSPDGEWLITSSDDGTARVWSVKTGKPRWAAGLTHDQDVNWAEFSPDGGRIVTASEDNTARLWNAATGTPIGEPMRHRGQVNQARFSRDGRWVVTAGADKKARVWDAQTGKPRTDEIWHAAPVTCAMFSPDGLAILTACAGSDGMPQDARLWDAATGRAIGPGMSHASGILDANCSVPGDLRFSRIVTASSDSTARLWDARSGRQLAGPLRHGSHVVSVAQSADGRLVATASRDGTARVWEAATGIAATPPLRHGNLLTHVDFHPSGRQLVTASVDGGVRLWNISAGEGAVDDWQVCARVLAGPQSGPEGLRSAENGAIEQEWATARSRLGDSGRSTVAQQVAWKSQIADQSGRSRRHHEALAAVAEGTTHLEGAQWDECIAAYRRAVELCVRDYNYPLLNSIARTLGTNLAVGDDAQRLLELLSPSQPRRIFLWLDRDQVQQHPASAGLRASSQPILGIGTANEPNNSGVRITSFLHNLNAEKAGLQVRDVITHLDGAAISDTRALTTAIRGKSPGQTVVVRVRRGLLVLNISIPVVSSALDQGHWTNTRQWIDNTLARWVESGHRPLFLAADRLQKSSAGVVRDGMLGRHLFGGTRTEYRNTLEQTPKGFYPTWIHVGGVGEDQLWSGIWVKEDVVRPWRHEIDLDLASLQARHAEYAAADFQMSAVCGYRTAMDQVRYVAAWVKRPQGSAGRGQRLVFHIEEPQLHEELGKLPKGWRPSLITAVREPGAAPERRFFTAIFVEDPAITRWAVQTNVPEWANLLNDDRYEREGFVLSAQVAETANFARNMPAADLAHERGRALIYDRALEEARGELTRAAQGASSPGQVAADLATAFIAEGKWSEAAAVLERYHASATGEGKPKQPYHAFGWWIAGPFSSDVEAPFRVENEIDPYRPESAYQAGDASAAQPVKWEQVTRYPLWTVSFGQRFDFADAVHGYGLLKVHSTREQPSHLNLNPSGPIKVWMNGALVHEQSGDRETADERIVPLQLRKGWNTILVRVDAHEGDHRLSVRFDTNGASAARIYARQGQHLRAHAQWSLAIAEQPQEPEFRVGRAQMAVAIGNFEGAVADLTAALKVRPRDPRILHEMACVYAQWSDKIADDASRQAERARLADEAARYARQSVVAGLTAGGTIAIENEPRLKAIRSLPEFIDIELAAKAQPELADAIYYRFADLESARWMSGYALQPVEDMHQQLVEQGNRPFYFVPWTDHGLMTRFAASWVRDGKPFKLSLHCDRAALEKDRNELREGFRPTSIEPYRWGDEMRYTAIWTREEPLCDWRMSLDLGKKELQEHLARNKSQGFRPAIVNAYHDLAGELKWAAVWMRDDAQTEIELEVSQEELQKKIDSLAPGWRPLMLDAYLNGTGRQYAAIFINDGRIYEWKVALAKPDSEILSQLQDIRSDDFWPIQQTVTPDPKSSQPFLDRANILARANRLDEALAELDRGVARLTDNAAMWLARARFHRDHGQASKAAADYAHVIRLSPDDDIARLERGQLAAYADAVTLVGPGAQWRWLHPTNGVDPAENVPNFHRTFSRVDFDDRRWKTGRDSGGPRGGFGYGEMVGVSIGRPPSGQRKTAYFRQRFTSGQPLENLVLTLQLDDGAVVYLDGKEVGRVRISRTARDSYNLLAQQVPEQDERKPVALSLPGRLEPGQHVLAISLHNNSYNSSDLRLAEVVLRGTPIGAKSPLPTDPQVLVDIGRHHEQSGNHAAADEAYTAALKIAPADAEIALRRGRLRASQDRLKDAVDDFTTVLAARPQDADLLIQRAVLAARLGRRESALADIAQATKLRPNDDLFRHRQGQLYAFLDTNVIVAPTSNWKWLHPTDGVDPAAADPDFHTAFASPHYDDSAWKAGRDGNTPADGFSYGAQGRVDLGTPPLEKRFTAYFRHSFSTDTQYDSLSLSALVDDGIIVYLDGVEVGRHNVRTGREAYKLMSRRSVASSGDAISLPLAGSLAPGDHVLAISLHNSASDSSDLRLRGVTLTGSRKQSQHTTLDDVQALLGRAETYLQLGQVDRGIADLTRAIELAPDDVDPLSKRADALMTQRRWKEAAADVTRLIERFEPRSVKRFEQRAECHENARQWHQAIADFTTAIGLAANSTARGGYLHQRGLCWARQLEWEKAADDFAAALDEPQWTPYLWGLNDSLSVFALLRQSQRQEKVLEIIFRRYSSDNPIPVDEVARAAALQSLDSDRAELLVRSVQAAPSGWRGVPAAALYRAGRYQEALDTLSRSTERLTEHRFVRALALHRLKRDEEALQALAEANEAFERQRATAGPGKFPAATWFDWTRVLVWHREANEAIIERSLAQLNRAIDAAPTSAAAHLARGRLHASAGKREEALRDLSKAIELDHRQSDAYGLRGDLHAKDQKWDAAAADYGLASKLAPDNQEHLNRLAKLASQAWLTVVSADAEKEPVEWKYAIAAPGADWTAPDFDDSDWKRGPAPFGSNSSSWDTARTEWTGSEIWLRREIELPERPAGFIVLRAKFDDQIEVFFNGVPAVESSEWGSYRTFVCSAASAAALKSGRNVIAIHCRNHEGPGVVDAGIYTADAEGRIVAILTEVIAGGADRGKALAKRAELNLRLGRWNEAAADLDKSLSQLPPVKDLWYGDLPPVLRDTVSEDLVFDRVAERRPGDATLWAARARHLGSRGRWRETADVMAKLREIAPDNLDVWYRSAPLSLFLRREKEYRRACREMLDRFGKSGDPTTLERTAKICALADEPTVPIAELRRLAQQAIERAAKDTSLLPWYHLALGLVEYRAGDFEAANKALARCSGDENPLSLLPATARIVAAMATAKSGKMDDARRQWEEARALGRRVPAVNSESVGRSWHDVLVHHLLTREAEELFEKKVEKD